MHPLCLGCSAVGKVVATSVVDHVIPHKGDAALFWDEANWQPCCGPHHDIVKQRLERMFACHEIKASDLRLDSSVAAKISRELLFRD